MTSRVPRPVVYLDSSALVKLVIDEPEHESLRQHLRVMSARPASSALARVEVLRAATIARPAPDAHALAERILGRCILLAVSDQVLREAGRRASLRLRSLDAIHLATALLVGPAELITYDQRLAEAAREHGLTVAQPGVATRRGRVVHDRDG